MTQTPFGTKLGSQVTAFMLALSLAPALSGCGQQAGGQNAGSSESPQGNLVPASVAPVASQEPLPTASEEVSSSEPAPSGSADCQSLGATEKGRPEIAGLTIGMTTDEVARRITCQGLSPVFSQAGGNYAVGHYLYVPPINGSMPIGQINADNGSARIKVVFFGLPGEERAIGIHRKLTFVSGEEPLVSTLQEQIQTKYGPLEDVYRQQRPGGDYIVAHLDRFVGTPYILGALGECLEKSSSISSEGYRFGTPGPKCGLLVAARATRKSDNPELATGLEVAISDGLYADKLRTAYMTKADDEAARSRRLEAEQARARKPDL